jgi:cysteine desulfuration protein SufE
MFESCWKKQEAIKELLLQCITEEDKYKKIIALGKELPRLEASQKIPRNIVHGCQSTMYLYSRLENGKLFFQADSEALISAGLAAILIAAYQGESPETLLKCPPSFLESLGIGATLTPSRANGLYSIHLKMKQDALVLLLNRSE